MYQNQDNLDMLNRAIKILVDRIALLDERTKKSSSSSIAYVLEASGKMAELARAVDMLMERQKIISESEAGRSK